MVCLCEWSTIENIPLQLQPTSQWAGWSCVNATKFHVSTHFVSRHRSLAFSAWYGLFFANRQMGIFLATLHCCRATIIGAIDATMWTGLVLGLGIFELPFHAQLLFVHWTSKPPVSACKATLTFKLSLPNSLMRYSGQGAVFLPLLSWYINKVWKHWRHGKVTGLTITDLLKVPKKRLSFLKMYMLKISHCYYCYFFPTRRKELSDCQWFLSSYYILFCEINMKFIYM